MPSGASKWVGGLPGPGVLALRSWTFCSDSLRWSSSQSVFLHGLDPGSNLGEAQIEEIVKFIAKTGRPRGSSPGSPDYQPVALPTALRWVICIQVSGWFYLRPLDFPSYVCHI